MFPVHRGANGLRIGEGGLGGVFINYRGEDTDTAAALIDRELAARFGSDRVFLDCRSIPAGVDFVEELLGRLQACSVLLVVIGPRWLTLTDVVGQRRIDDPQDWIRREIVEAFNRGLRVIPVLTGNVRLPAEAGLPQDIAGLSRRQYVPLRRRYTSVDLAFLVERITEADPELANVAVWRQLSNGPQQLPVAAKPVGTEPKHVTRARRLVLLPMAVLLLVAFLLVSSDLKPPPGTASVMSGPCGSSYGLVGHHPLSNQITNAIDGTWTSTGRRPRSGIAW
jgi:TIR domain